MVEGQVAAQFSQTQEADPLEPGTGDPGADVQVIERGRPLVELEHARVDLVERPLAWVICDPQVQPPKVSAFLQGLGTPALIRCLTH